MSHFRAHLAAFVAISLFAGTAYGAEETRSVPAFNAIAFGGSATVDVTVGKAQSLVLAGDAELLRHITTTVENGQLEIRTENGFHWNGERLAVRVSLPHLTALRSSGSATTTIAGFNGGDTAFKISGSGTITATGTVDKLDVRLSGSGKAQLDKLNTQAATVEISGRGNVVVQPKQTLVSTISGSGEVRYIGSPQVTTRVSGSGHVLPQ